MLLILGSLLFAACGRKPDAEAKAKDEAYQRFKAASDAFDQGDLVTSRERFQDIVDRAKEAGNPEEERSSYLGLARVLAYLSEIETPGRSP